MTYFDKIVNWENVSVSFRNIIIQIYLKTLAGHHGKTPWQQKSVQHRNTRASEGLFQQMAGLNPRYAALQACLESPEGGILTVLQ